MFVAVSGSSHALSVVLDLFDFYPDYSSRQNSYHGNHQLSGEDGSRKRKHTAAEEHGEGKVEEVWTEHMSSKGRVYYYNQLTTKSQWTRPLTGIIKK